MEIPTQNGNAIKYANGQANGRVDGHFLDGAGRVRQRKAVIVGAGPVGCLAAIALANKGWFVEVYEGRAGVVCFSSLRTKFINLSLLLRQAFDEVARRAAFD